MPLQGFNSEALSVMAYMMLKVIMYDLHQIFIHSFILNIYIAPLQENYSQHQHGQTKQS